jgi:hypothetical protein
LFADGIRLTEGTVAIKVLEIEGTLLVKTGDLEIAKRKELERIKKKQRLKIYRKSFIMLVEPKT